MTNFSKFEALTSNEMEKISGGSDGWALIVALWNATEPGACTTVYNQDNGTFAGNQILQSGLSMQKESNVLAVELPNRNWWVTLTPVS